MCVAGEELPICFLPLRSYPLITQITQKVFRLANGLEFCNLWNLWNLYNLCNRRMTLSYF